MNQSDNEDALEIEKANDAATADAPFVAKLVTPESRSDDFVQVGGDAPAEGVDGLIHVGSPFRSDPAELPASIVTVSVPSLSGEAAYGEFGPFRYTAMGASTAAVAVLLFAAIGAWWFPTGGALVAVLGTVLSIVGLFSTKRFRLAAFAMLPLHVSLFFLSYVRSLA